MTLHERTGRLDGLALASRIMRDPTAVALVAFNLAVGIFVLYHPPYAQNLLFLYWCDCILIGLFGALKIFFVPIGLGSEADKHPKIAFGLRMAARTFLAAMFLFVYGFVLLCVTALLGGLAGEEARIRQGTGFDEPAFIRGLWLPIGALLVSHLLSFAWNFLGKREYQGRSAQDQMARPFGRVMLLLFVLCMGGIAVSVFRLPFLLVAVFVVVKTAADLASHLWEHGAAKTG